MPFRYRDAQDQNLLKDRIVERVLATGSVEAACAEEGMPHHETVRRWALADVSFGEALKTARAKGWARRKWAFDDVKAKRVLGHLAAGGKLKKLPKGPEWPTVGMVQHWRATDGEFGAEVLRLQAVGRDLRNWGRPVGRPRKAFDRALADRVICEVARGARVDRLEAVDPALPGRGLIRRWRREDEEFATGLAIAIKVSRTKRFHAGSMLTPELRRTIIDRIREGASLSSLGEEPGMPCKVTLYGWIGRNEEFAREVMAACDDREDWWGDVIGDAMEQARSGPARRRLAAMNSQWARHQNRPGRKWRT